jgi:RNA-directed DNA polymerase
MRTEKSRMRRGITSLQDLMRQMRHLTIREQVDHLNVALRGHYAYYRIARNIRSLQKVYRTAERYWRKMLCTRSWAVRLTWAAFNQIKTRTPLLRPKLYIPYRELQALVVL